MTDESDPIGDDENVLRRILNREKYIDLTLRIPVIRLAFRPTKDDATGISVYRSLFACPREVAKAGTNSAGYWVAELPIAAIRDLQLTVMPDPLPEGLKGHALIPEIRTSTNEETTAQQQELAQLASLRLVYDPDTN